MPTIFTHPAVPLALGLSLGSKLIPKRLLLAGIIASILPDLDVIAFKLHIAYSHDFGHRGVSHSLLFALLIAIAGSLCWKYFDAGYKRIFAFLFVSTASHGVLDAFTTGGLGIAFFWPFSSERHFFTHQVIKVSPIGTDHLLTERFLIVLQSELLWVWLPAVLLFVMLRVSMRLDRKLQTKPGNVL